VRGAGLAGVSLAGVAFVPGRETYPYLTAALTGHVRAPGRVATDWQLRWS
jgi:hypothetical protein